MTLDEVSPSKVWAVGAMGSCRVHTPLTLAAKAGLIEFAWEGAYGFRHNPLELLQGLGILRGTVKAPPELTDLLNLVKPSAFGETDRYKLRFSNVEAMIVEVSSIRVIEVDGWQLQLNRFREALVKGGVAERDVSNLFQLEPVREPVLRALRAGGAAELAAVVERAGFYELPPTPLIDAIRKLRRGLDLPVILVGTVNYGYDGSWIAQRVSRTRSSSILRSSRAGTRCGR